MKSKLIALSALLFISTESTALATVTLTQHIATIIMNLNDRPTTAEKNDLNLIAGDSDTPEDIRILATALINMDHAITPVDREKLKRLADDMSAPQTSRDMAIILIHMKHWPTEADKRRLSEIATPK